MRMSKTTKIAAAAAVLLAGALVANEALAYRMIQNTTVGRVSAGYAVACNASGGFTHWANANIPWRLNTSARARTRPPRCRAASRAGPTSPARP